MTSGSDPLAFLKLMPGFDFMRQFTQAATDKNAIPNLTEWVTPTASVEEIDKRIANLKAVQGWLEQNVQILAATVQALEIQKMTLAVLQGMNLSQADIAKAFTAPPEPPRAQAAPQPAPAAAQPAAPTAKPATAAPKAAPAAAKADPVQWWEALTRQFQTISANALREAVQTLPPITPVAPAKPAPAAKSAGKSAPKPGAQSKAKRAAPKPSAKAAARRGAA